MLTIVFGVGMFTVVILLLVVVLMLARSKLVNTQNVRIDINGDPELALTTPAGSTLLSTLSARGCAWPAR